MLPNPECEKRLYTYLNIFLSTFFGGNIMKIARLNRYDSDSKTKAFFDIETDEGIVIKGFKLIDGANGLFASAPSEKGKDDKYYDKVIIPQELKKQLNEMALEKYNEASAASV